MAPNSNNRATHRTGAALRILLVDDEPVQLETIRRGLFLFGHETLTASDSEQALCLLREERDRIDLLVTDLTLPGASGFDIIREACGCCPGLPVLAITGLTRSSGVEALRLIGVPVLQKPFSPDELEARIQALVLGTKERS